MSNRYKPILPSPIVRNPTPSAGDASSSATSPVPASSTALSKRRAAVRIACNGCRAKRTACDGNRPTCSACAKRGSGPCVYVSTTPTETPAMVMKRELDGLRNKYSNLAEVFDMLRDLPEERSAEALRNLRLITAIDPAVLLSSIRTGAPADDALPRHVLLRPPRQDSKEFELMLRHATAYPTLLPLDSSAVSTTTYFPRRAAPTQESGRAASSALRPLGVSQPSPGHRSPTSANPLEDLSTDPTEYCDARLSTLNISYWTRIPIPNQLAARLISLYLKTDHPTLGLFEASLFLDDLIDRRPRYCSSLLVCSILVWACHAYSTLVDLEGVFGYGSVAFLAEANVLWEYEQARDSLPTLAAAQLLNLNSIYNGGNGLPYLSAGSHMAQRMGLFGNFRTRKPVPVGHKLTSSTEDMEDWERAVAHTAWGVYNCVAMNAFMFQSCEPAVAFPPLLVTPGALSDRQSDEAVMDGAPAHDLPDYMGRTFPALCGFWVITSEWTSRYYLPMPKPVVGRVPWSFAEAIFQKLLDWADGLHFRLARGDQTPHHSTILHIWYHASISQLFRPFALTPGTEAQPHLDPEDSLRAAAIFQASLHQLKHMTLAFPYTYTCHRYAIFWHMALLYVANAALEDISDPHWRAYFTLCLNCYADLFGTFRVAGGIVRSLLSMALRKGMMNGGEAQALLQRVSNKGRDYEILTATSSGFVVDLNLAVTDRNAAQLEPLTELFDSLRLFHEFIHAEVPDGPLGGADPPDYGTSA